MNTESTQPPVRRVASATVIVAAVTALLLAMTGCQEQATALVVEVTGTVRALAGLTEAVRSLGEPEGEQTPGDVSVAQVEGVRVEAEVVDDDLERDTGRIVGDPLAEELCEADILEWHRGARGCHGPMILPRRA